MIQKVLNQYTNLLKTRPMLTRCVTSCCVLTLGDLFCQKVIEKRTVLDIKRNNTAMFMGLLIVGPSLHLWYQVMLPRVISVLSQKYQIVLKYSLFFSTLIDQIIFAPYTCSNYCFFVSYFKDFDHQKAIENWQNKIGSVLKMNYYVWPFFNYINFKFIPLIYRTLFVNFCALFWNSYLSFKNREVSKRLDQLNL